MSEKEKPMTVGELIEALKKVDPNLPVWHEGCDCHGAARSVEVDAATEHDPLGSVMITRWR